MFWFILYILGAAFSFGLITYYEEKFFGRFDSEYSWRDSSTGWDSFDAAMVKALGSLLWFAGLPLAAAYLIATHLKNQKQQTK